MPGHGDGRLSREPYPAARTRRTPGESPCAPDGIGSHALSCRTKQMKNVGPRTQLRPIWGCSVFICTHLVEPSSQAAAVRLVLEASCAMLATTAVQVPGSSRIIAGWFLLCLGTGPLSY